MILPVSRWLPARTRLRYGGTCAFFTGWRHRIDTTVAPRMAAADTFTRQQTATGSAVHLYGFHRVSRATRVKTAVLPQQRADRIAIKAQQQQEQGFHFGSGLRQAGALNKCSSSLRSKRFKAAVRAGPSLVLTGRDRRTMQSILFRQA